MRRIVFVGATANGDLRGLLALLDGEPDWRTTRVPEAPTGPDLERADLVVTSPDLDGSHLRRLLDRAQRRHPPVPVVAAVGQGDVVRIASPSFTSVSEFLVLPVSVEESRGRLRRLLSRRATAEREDLTHRLLDQTALDMVVGTAPALRAVKARLPLVARSDTSVVITGETGTGKEVVARAVHGLSRRAKGPFVPVNCGAIPGDLVENELFGHRRGAFTDARDPSPGVVAEAEGGTLFLDEIDAVPLSGQVKLLRFLQDRTYRPLGAGSSRQADVRIVAATNADLDECVRAGRFREDLYFRLNVIALALPPLRERPEDVPLLAEHLLRKHTAPEEPWSLRPELLAHLAAQPWPGNVRQLENLIQRMVALGTPGPLGLEHLPDPVSATPPPAVPESPVSFREAKARAVERFEREYTLRLLAWHDGNVTRAAAAANKDRRAFGRLVKKYAGVRPTM